tara:strand:+ start:4720 stop:5061 length:342 start_codon:yes stop_codon:yes gene_type:complete
MAPIIGATPTIPAAPISGGPWFTGGGCCPYMLGGAPPESIAPPPYGGPLGPEGIPGPGNGIGVGPGSGAIVGGLFWLAGGAGPPRGCSTPLLCWCGCVITLGTGGSWLGCGCH